MVAVWSRGLLWGSLSRGGMDYLGLQFHDALPPFAAICQGLRLAQTHGHELVLQFAQDQLPRGLLPAATTGKMSLEEWLEGF